MDTVAQIDRIILGKKKTSQTPNFLRDSDEFDKSENITIMKHLQELISIHKVNDDMYNLS